MGKTVETVDVYINSTDSSKTTVKFTVGKKSFSTVEQNEFLKAQILLPLLSKMLKKHKLSFRDIRAIEVNPGPGSFTGIRVGVAVANTLGWALGVPVNGRQVQKQPVEPLYS
ncbi:hypothetical protein HY405_00415 [Candidatus Microgenomates bacterium]|nr:hypothetical protein [Candidatus Microgenomates bacterium]